MACNYLPPILVAIKCMTYNQKPFISDALNGFTMQKTTFPFLIILVDDASTDGEPEVIKQYINANFDISNARISYTKEDDDAYYLFAQHTNNQECYIIYLQLKANLYDNPRKQCLFEEWVNSAKYIALCEGDDYWINPDKLQKQVSFLEENPDFSLCCHRCEEYVQHTGKFVKEHLPAKFGELSIFDLADGNLIHTPSVIYRSDTRLSLDRKRLPMNLPVGDYVQWLLLAQYGKIYKFSEEMAVYRVGVGTWGSRDISYTIPRWSNLLSDLSVYFKDFPDIQTKLKEQNFQIIESNLTNYENEILRYQQLYRSVCSSKAYKLGKILLFFPKKIKKALHFSA